MANARYLGEVEGVKDDKFPIRNEQRALIIGDYDGGELANYRQ